MQVRGTFDVCSTYASKRPCGFSDGASLWLQRSVAQTKMYLDLDRHRHDSLDATASLALEAQPFAEHGNGLHRAALSVRLPGRTYQLRVLERTSCGALPRCDATAAPAAASAAAVIAVIAATTSVAVLTPFLPPSSRSAPTCSPFSPRTMASRSPSSPSRVRIRPAE